MQFSDSLLYGFFPLTTKFQLKLYFVLNEFAFLREGSGIQTVFRKDF